MRYVCGMLLWLALGMVAYAAPPKASITGPTGGVPGDILILDASKSADSKFYDWRVYPELPNGRPTLLVMDEGKRCIVASVPGTYIVFLSVANDEGIDMLRWAVHVSGTPPPPPPGPDPPKPVPPEPVLTGLAKQVYDRAKVLNDPATSATLAENYETISSAIAAGAYAGDLLVAKVKIQTDIRDKNFAVLENRPAWLSFFRGDLAKWCDSLDADGKLNSTAAVQEMFDAIAKGFRAASRSGNI